MDRAANQEICDSNEVNQMFPRQNVSFEQRDRENGNIRDVIPSKWVYPDLTFVTFVVLLISLLLGT